MHAAGPSGAAQESRCPSRLLRADGSLALPQVPTAGTMDSSCAVGTSLASDASGTWATFGELSGDWGGPAVLASCCSGSCTDPNKPPGGK